MAGKSIENTVESLIYDLLKFMGYILSCFFVGFRELGKKTPFIVFTTAASAVVILFILKHFFGVGEYDYVLYSAVLPAAVLLVLGAMKKQKQQEYQKSFENIGFKGKNGRVPQWISSTETTKGKTTAYFKSNIPLSGWKKNTELLQTEFDCKILLIEQGNSKKVTKLVYVAADHDIGDLIHWNNEYISKKKTEIVLGESIYSQIKFDFNITPHWIFAGATNSGKSVLLRSVVYQCIVKEFRVILMDFKRGVEFGRMYDRFCEVVMEKKRAVEILQFLVEENKRRLDLFREKEIKNLDEYNKRFPNDPLEYIITAIDELAILVKSLGGKEEKELTILATYLLENLAILGRAAGIYLVFGIQRPDADTVSGQIKSNVTGRVCGHFSDAAPSLIVLNNTKANELPSKTKGRFMFQDGEETIEFQGYLLDDTKEIKELPDREPPEPSPNDETMPPSIRLVETPKKAKKGKKTGLDTDYEDCMEEM